jgi:hypothetical protein
MRECGPACMPTTPHTRHTHPTPTVPHPHTPHTRPTRRQSFTWATYQTNNILTLRSVAANSTVQCYYARMTGNGDNRAVTFLTLGGAPVTANFQLQCDPANYERYANYLTQPVCRTPETGLSAYNSTTLQTLAYRGNGVPESNGAAALAASAGTALLGAALVALAAVGVGA